ncbi:MAG: Hsp70 family protein [Polyangiaceae bacterium]|nr:Hsp70 family protein [Polyangiaceae bacterium]MCW5790411.1 Hsp70 family protein [Polyangiaceae bacterium]
MPAEPRTLVGIDLGTTHTVVAYARLTGRAGPPPIELFRVPQLIGRGEVAARDLFPSFLYAPLPEEPFEDRWGDAPWVTGELARDRGAEVPGRQIASPKSWLSHTRVDRRAPILPWGTDTEGLPRLSPVEASARLLRHIHAAWDAAHPELPLAEQQVILTVPASFDQAARELTLTAARDAGLRVRLLEEPQAAFYAYLTDRGFSELSALVQGEEPRVVLVCDVGGGTTDLTLVEIRRETDGAPGDQGADGAGASREPRFGLERVAVGSHLLLGGDNLDLALAHLIERRMSDESLDPQRFAQLVATCRAAKERLLSADAPEQVTVRLLGRGAALLSGGLSASLSREEVVSLLDDGFLPESTLDARPRRARGGLVAFGLPFEADPAITHHLAWFLSRHRGERALPSAVLYNGGLFRAARARERLTGLLERWSGAPVTALTESDPERAVARGAVAFGLALRGLGPKIGGGSPRGYYIGVAAGRGERRAVCVVPQGAEEGQEYRADSLPLRLLLGRAARFELHTSDSSAADLPGSVVTLDDERFTRLPRVASRFDEGVSGEIPVALVGELTPLGTLELACVEQLPAGAPAGAERRFALAFDLRGDDAEPPEQGAPSERGAQPRTSEPPRSIAAPPEASLLRAVDLIDRVYGKRRADVKPREVKDLVRELERTLGERRGWSVATNRRLYDALLVDPAARRRSADHERVFWLLAGFTLRPGVGYPGDNARAERLALLIGEALTFHTESRNWQALWVALRRVAAGLSEPAQLTIRDLIDPFLAPPDAKLRRPKKLKPTHPTEMLELASSLERLPAARRAELGAWVLERTWTDRDPRLWEALARIGARNPTYASAHHVVPTRTVERWFDHVLQERWEEVPSAAICAVSLARVTEDRTRDLSEAVREGVVRRLTKAAQGGMPIEVTRLDEWARALREFVPLSDADRAQFFGEELPEGLRLEAM